MNEWNNEELRRRQQADDVGFLNLDALMSRRRAKVLIVPGAVVLVGVILVLINVLAGLGVFMVLGGMFGLVVVAITAWLGALSLNV